MTLLSAAGIVIQGHPHQGGGQSLVRVAPQPIFYAGLFFVGTVALSYWLAVRRHLENCKCPKPRKWWKR